MFAGFVVLTVIEEAIAEQQFVSTLEIANKSSLSTRIKSPFAGLLENPPLKYEIPVIHRGARRLQF